MNERLTKALEFANYRQTLNTQMQVLKIRAEGLLIYAEAGGKFTITQELMCFLDYLIRSGHTDATLIDDNQLPVFVADTQAFLKGITTRYFGVANDYLQATQAIRKSRTVSAILAIKDPE